jgi:hypothetical protein
VVLESRYGKAAGKAGYQIFKKGPKWIVSIFGKEGEVLAAEESAAVIADYRALKAAQKQGLAIAPKTPSSGINRLIQRQGGYIDPVTNQWVKKTLGGGPQIHSAHIYPADRIKQLAGFEQLTRGQQNFLLNHPDNFIPLPKQWNSSMGNSLADEWAKTPRGRLASKEFIDELRESQQAFEGFAKGMIDFWLRK